MTNKTLAVFAGANGSGKSTIVRKILSSGSCPDYFICPDNLVDIANKDNVAAYIQAMNKAEQLRESALLDETSFSFETVLSTVEKVDFIRRARQKGYTIQVFYVLTESVDVNIARVAKRVSQGGHDVPRDKIISRYERAMELMPEVLKLADFAVIFDNSGDMPKALMFYSIGSEVTVQLGEHIADVKDVIITTGALPVWFVTKHYEKIKEALKRH